VRETRRDLEQMLDLGGPHEWRPLILETVATDGTGTEALWEAIVAHRQFLAGARHDDDRRARTRTELDRVIAALVRTRVSALAQGTAYEAQVDALMAGTTDPYRAAEALLSDS